MKRQKKTNHSALELGWDVFKQALPKDIVRLALKKRNQITKEVKYYADEIVHTLTRADFLANKNKLVREAKQNLEKFIKKIQKSDVASKAADLAANKGNELLSLLNFPTKKEVSKLNSRLSQLEKRLKGLGRQGPSANQ